MDKENKPKIILGIDPGTRFTGYGILRIHGNQVLIETYGYLDLSKIDDPYISLEKIFTKTTQLIESYDVQELAIESQFFGKNVQSMLKLGRAQGVAIAAAVVKHINVYEYSPRKIKMAITGNGNASKEQVASFLQRLIPLQELPENLDTTDGLAVALCHHYQSKVISGSSYKNWKDFIKKHPDKLV